MVTDTDLKRPPFDQFKGLQSLTTERRGHVSRETERHHLYVGTDRRTNTSVLIKVTSRPGLVYQDNLKNEIACLEAVNASLPDSAYFPVLREHGELRDGRVYIVATFFPELPLATAIGPDRIPGKTVSYLRTALEVARALGQLHALSIFHVDLNPMNVLLRLEHGSPIVRLIDFESSYQSSRHGNGGVFYNPPNTPGYSAPEIPARTPDVRSDVFSLGAVLYTMLAGFQWTWESEAWKAAAADRELDADIKRIVLQAVDPDPDQRYQSIREFHSSLGAYLESIWPGRAGVRHWP